MMPAMSEEHIAIIAELISNRHLRCLEWGAGGSTTYYPQFLGEGGVWLSIEGDPGWKAKVEESGLRSGVQVYLYSDDSTDYCDAPLGWGMFDLILVDGKTERRAECLEIAKRAVKDDGCILLHDAQRSEYHAACAGLEIQRHIDKHREELWAMRKPERK